MSESAEAKCDPFLQILEPMVRKMLADKGGWEAEDWDEKAFQGFFCEIALWLKNEKKKKKNFIAKTVAGLISYGVTVEEELQNIGRGDYDKFKALLVAEGVPNAICDLLFEKYVSRKQRRVETDDASAAESELKWKKNSLNLFMRVFHKGELQVASRSKIIRFETGLWGVPMNANFIFIRDCYGQIFEKAMSNLMGNEKICVAVMGTPGIGKTVFGLYALFRLLKDGNTVVYQNSSSKQCYLLGPLDSPIIESARKCGCSIPPSKSSEIYCGTYDPVKSEYLPLTDFLEQERDLFYIYDPPKKGIDLSEFMRCKLLIVSSPHRSSANSLKNKTLIFYMPIWEYEELEIVKDFEVENFLSKVEKEEDLINRLMELSEGQSKKCLSELSKEELKQRLIELSKVDLKKRWLEFGGVPRWVLESGIGWIGKNILLEAKGKVDVASIKDLLDPFISDGRFQQEHSGLVVHMCPSENFDTYTVKIATLSIFEEILTKLNLRTNHEVSEWAKVISRSTQINMGSIMELCWHKLLGFGGSTMDCTIRELTESGESIGGVKVTIPEFSRVVTFGRNDMLDLKELKVGEYCLPQTPNLKAVDSFALFNTPFCDPTNTNTCLVGFQMTLNKAGHDLNLGGGRAIRRKFKELLGLEQPANLTDMYIVFVTTKEVEPSFKRKQSWKCKNSVTSIELDAVRQFVLVLPDDSSTFRDQPR